MSPSAMPGKVWWTMKRVSSGSGLSCPRILSSCEIEITSANQDVGNIPRHTQFVISKPSSLLFVAIEECLWSMKSGATCDLQISIQECPYLLKSEKTDHIPTKLRLTLVSFTPGKTIWAMDCQSSLDHSGELKEKGVEYFKLGHLSISFWYFSQALRILVGICPGSFVDDEQNKKKHHDLKLSCYLNLSLFQLNNKSYTKVVRNCSKALELDPNCIKALYRRGAALTELQEFDEADTDLRKALLCEPGNKCVEKQLKVLNQKMSAYNLQYKKSMKKMFDCWFVIRIGKNLSFYFFSSSHSQKFCAILSFI